jgi:succinate dehydrogenase / fumarate reductase flavoprotein subunit
MQGLSDGYFIVPLTVGDYLATAKPTPVSTEAPEVKQSLDMVKKQTQKFLDTKGKRSVDSFHRELGKVMWEDCGMARSRQSLEHALSKIPDLREEFHRNVFIPGTGEELNQSLEKAGRVADFMELAELMCMDALQREESCGGHFRVEHQTPDGEALRDDEHFAHTSVWEYRGPDQAPRLHQEPLKFEHVALAQRSYK